MSNNVLIGLNDSTAQVMIIILPSYAAKTACNQSLHGREGLQKISDRSKPSPASLRMKQECCLQRIENCWCVGKLKRVEEKEVRRPAYKLAAKSYLSSRT